MTTSRRNSLTERSMAPGYPYWGEEYITAWTWIGGPAISSVTGSCPCEKNRERLPVVSRGGRSTSSAVMAVTAMVC